MRALALLAALLSVIALTVCSVPDDGSEQPRREQVGPSTGVGAGVGF
jgi:hypothetical protein